MRYIFKLGLQCLIAAAVMPHGRAAVVEYQIACPDLFDARNVHFNTMPQGWTPFAPSSLMVRTGRIMFGGPETKSDVNPSSSVDSKYSSMAAWQLRNVPGLQKWLTCGYGAASELTLSKIIPQDVYACTVITSKDLQANVTGVVAECLRDVKPQP